MTGGGKPGGDLSETTTAKSRGFPDSKPKVWTAALAGKAGPYPCARKIHGFSDIRETGNKA